jgi:hypothetical protein
MKNLSVVLGIGMGGYMTTENPYVASAAKVDDKETKPSLVALIIAIIGALALCLITAYLTMPIFPAILSMTEQEICRSYTTNFYVGSTICVLPFILIAYAFRKLLLAVIVIPSTILGFYMFVALINDDSISSYGYFAKHCLILGNL